MTSALGGPAGWLLILLSISVLTVGFERIRFWSLWWRRRTALQQQWRDLVRSGGSHPSAWIEERDQDMRFAEPFLEATIVIAPLIGLIGTVLGLSRLLSAMGPQMVLPAGSAPSGFGQVLLTTALGLIVSLMATLILHTNNGLRRWQCSRWRRELSRQVLGDPQR